SSRRRHTRSKRDWSSDVCSSDLTLYAVNDRSSPATEPYDVSKIRMNAIGGYNWRWPGQWITWQIDVPEDGLYQIGVKNKQNTLRSEERRVGKEFINRGER